MSADRPLVALEDIHLIADATKAFEETCEAENYTDTGLMWELLDAAMAILNGQQAQYLIEKRCDPRRTLRRFIPTQEAP